MRPTGFQRPVASKPGTLRFSRGVSRTGRQLWPARHVVAVCSLACLLALSCSAVVAGGERVLASKRSPYSVVSVVERGNRRFLKLGALVQSGWNPRRPYEMPYAYSKLMGTGVCAWPGSATARPGRVLIVGLGGGTLSRHLVHRHPNLQVTVVELDPVVVEFARRYFGLSPKVRVHVADGRAYLTRSPERYDIIALDAFSETYIPPALMTREFLQLVRRRLRPGGLVIVNTWSSSRWSDYETRTYQSVFRVLLELRHPEDPNSNRILLVGPAVDSLDGVRRRATATATRIRFDEFSVPRILGRLRHLTRKPAVPILTDANVERLVPQ